MIRLRRRRHNHLDPERARREAEARRQQALERWAEVYEVAEPLRQAERANHFADLFPELGGGPR